jgi:aspartate/tyrosine/aromatic aminotransferase
MPLLDFAYQGLKDEPEEDRKVLDYFLSAGMEFLIAWSGSKNHSLYSLRVGLAGAVTKNATTKEKIEGHYMRITRGMHSAAGVTGQAIVAEVQKNYCKEWRDDLRAVRAVLSKKRMMLRQALPKKFTASLDGNGLFAMLPLEKSEVAALKKEHVFMPDDGRINIAGIPEGRIEEFAKKVARITD